MDYDELSYSRIYILLLVVKTQSKTKYSLINKISRCSKIDLQKEKNYFFTKKYFYKISHIYDKLLTETIKGFIGYPLDKHLS